MDSQPTAKSIEPKDIDMLKKGYWREYRNQYRKEYRKRRREVSTRLRVELYEKVKERVQVLGLSIPSYLKQLISTDLSQEVSLGVSENVVLAQTISKIYDEIQDIVRNYKVQAPPASLYTDLLRRIEFLERTIIGDGSRE